MEREEVKELLNNNPEFYANIRLTKELTQLSKPDIRNNLEYEIALYKHIPLLVDMNYETSEHFLAYISLIKKM